jgi:exosortase E/protease (VPEID-CTERM system)
VRWGALAALLLLELVTLSIRFDTSALQDVSGEWALAVAITPRIIRLALLAVVVGIVLHSRTLLNELQANRTLFAARRGWLWSLVVHLSGLLLFAWLTSQVLEHGRANGRLAAIWVMAWACSGGLTLAGCAIAALPATVWRRLVESSWSGLLIGCGVGVAVWASELRADGLWQPLARATLWCVGGLLQLIYPEVVFRPSNLVIGTSSFAVRIDPDCSGYEGMALILAFLGGYLWFDRDTLRLPRALILLPLGAIASLVANVLRMALLVVIGSSWSESIAMGGFHSQAGAIAFASIGLGLVVVARRSAWLSRPAVAAHEEASNPTAAYLVPMLSIIAVGMLTGAFSHGIDALYPLRVLAAVVALWCFRGYYAQVRWDGSLVAAVLGAAIFALWVILAPSDGQAADPSSALAAWPPAWRAVWWTARIAGYLIVVPVVEELAFRGFLMRRLIATDFESVSWGRISWWSWGASSLAFGALHGSFWIAGAVAGLAYGYAVQRRGSLGDAVLAHAATNLLLFVYVVLTGNWSLLS